MTVLQVFNLLLQIIISKLNDYQLTFFKKVYSFIKAIAMLQICLGTVIPGYILFGPLSIYLRIQGEIQRKKVIPFRNIVHFI